MDHPVRRYSSNAAGTSSSGSSPNYGPGPSSSYQRNSMVPQPRSAPDLHGRARKKAAMNRCNQEIRQLQEELHRSETLPPASEVCKEFVHSVESQSDPFVANSAAPSQWDQQLDRWFRAPPVPKSACCCIPAIYN